MVKFRQEELSTEPRKYRMGFAQFVLWKEVGQRLVGTGVNGLALQSPPADECQRQTSQESLALASSTWKKTMNDTTSVLGFDWVTCPKGGKLAMLETGGTMVSTVRIGGVGAFCLGILVERNSGTKS